MKEKRDIRDYLQDIESEISNIKQFTSGLSYEEFIKDTKTLYAAIRSFEVIGEAVKNIPDEIKDTYPYVATHIQI